MCDKARTTFYEALEAKVRAANKVKNINACKNFLFHNSKDIEKNEVLCKGYDAMGVNFHDSLFSIRR